MFKETRIDFNFTTIIAQGLGIFDMEILLKFPLALATKCYSNVFTTFKLRGYFLLDHESQIQEEYLSYVDELRVKFAEFDQPRLLVPDANDLLMGQTTIQTRPLLLRTFKLVCLCLDERLLPAVKVSTVNTEDPASKLIDIVLPVQSYFSHVVNSIETATTDASISEFLEMEFTFGRGALINMYDPRPVLDNFGKAEIPSKLDPENEYQCKTGRGGVSSSVGVQQSPSTLKSPKKNVRPTRLLSDAEIGQSAKSLRQCSSKN